MPSVLLPVQIDGKVIRVEVNDGGFLWGHQKTTQSDTWTEISAVDDRHHDVFVSTSVVRPSRLSRWRSGGVVSTPCSGKPSGVHSLRCNRSHSDGGDGVRLTGLDMSSRHVSGRKLPLAAGNTPISCSRGLNWKMKVAKNKSARLEHSKAPFLLLNHYLGFITSNRIKRSYLQHYPVAHWRCDNINPGRKHEDQETEVLPAWCPSRSLRTCP